MWGLTQKHENKINVQEVREADRGANHFSQRNAEEFRFIKDGDGLDHCKSYVGLRDKSIYKRVYIKFCFKKSLPSAKTPSGYSGIQTVYRSQVRVFHSVLKQPSM